jgi:hypothetical protein
MKVMMITADEVVAKVWDDYLHRFGAQDYVMARYLAPPTTIPMNDDAGDYPPAEPSWIPPHSSFGSRSGRPQPNPRSQI